MYLSFSVRRATFFFLDFAEVCVDILQKISPKVLVRCKLVKEKVQEEREKEEEEEGHGEKRMKKRVKKRKKQSRWRRRDGREKLIYSKNIQEPL